MVGTTRPAKGGALPRTAEGTRKRRMGRAIDDDGDEITDEEIHAVISAITEDKPEGVTFAFACEKLDLSLTRGHRILRGARSRGIVTWDETAKKRLVRARPI